MEYYERLKGLREDKDLTQIQLARIFHVSQNTISKYERGTREVPIDILIKYTAYFNVSSDYILDIHFD